MGPLGLLTVPAALRDEQNRPVILARPAPSRPGWRAGALGFNEIGFQWESTQERV